MRATVKCWQFLAGIDQLRPLLKEIYQILLPDWCKPVASQRPRECNLAGLNLGRGYSWRARGLWELPIVGCVYEQLGYISPPKPRFGID